MLVCQKIFNKFFFYFILFSFVNAYSEFNTDRYKGVCLELSYSSGMFAVFGSVLGALQLYDLGYIEGVKVNLDSGVYLDSEIGANWWEYFFEPINLGNSQSTLHKTSPVDGDELANICFTLQPRRANELIRKYIRIKSHVQASVDLYVKENLDSFFVIGVHHRGTDKIIEWPLVAYEKTYQNLVEMMSKLSNEEKERLKIYVATDDQHFLTFMKDRFSSLVISNNFVRSVDGTPLHYGYDKYKNNYQKGSEALIDCLLLSKCQMLLRPDTSCLSLMSCFFNPQMPVISLRAD